MAQARIWKRCAGRLATGWPASHRVILIDRPGHGWSSAVGEEASTPAAQGRMIEEALKKLDVGPVILVVHSWAGALGARMALDYPARVAGLVMLAPVAYPWPGGVGWYNELVTKPVIGPLLAYTITLPLGYFLAESRRARRCSCRRSCRMISSPTPRRRCCCARASFLPTPAIW